MEVEKTEDVEEIEEVAAEQEEHPVDVRKSLALLPTRRRIDTSVE
jgi:hypothetical protein